MKYYDEKNCLVNLGNSLLRHFGVKTFHPSIKEIDDFLGNYKKVVVILLDGFGKSVMEKHLDENSFLRKHVIHQITSTFPPTTVAATTGLLSAKFPIENGFMAWSMYIKEVDQNVDVFRNRNSQTHEEISYHHSLRNPYPNLVALINQKYQREIAFNVLSRPVDKSTPRFPYFQLRKTYKLVNRNESGFVYCYFVSPDHQMHQEGVMGKHAHKFILKMDRLINKFSRRFKDVVTLVIADHGMVDITSFNLNDHPDLLDLLIRPYTMESRCASFFVKKGKSLTFAELLKKYYGNHFDVYLKEEVLKNHLFGVGEPSILALDTIGDVIAIANDQYAFTMNPNDSKKGHHGGGTSNERLINVIGIKS